MCLKLMKPAITQKSPASMGMKPPITQKSPAAMGMKMPPNVNKPLPKLPGPPTMVKPNSMRAGYRQTVYKPSVPAKPPSVVKPAITESSPASRGMQPKLTINTGSLPKAQNMASPTPTTPEMMALFGMKPKAPMSPASQLKAVQKAGEDLSFLYTKKTPGQRRGSMIMKKAKARSGGKNVPTKIKNFFGKFRKW